MSPTGQNDHSDGSMLFVNLNQRKNPVATEAVVAGFSRSGGGEARTLTTNQFVFCGPDELSGKESWLQVM